MFTKLNLFILLTMAMLLVACDTQPEPASLGSQQAPTLASLNLAEGEKLIVLATTNIVGDLVRNVGGDKITLTTLLPPGSDPHTFSPTPQDVVAVSEAQVVFINGLHLEEFLDELIQNAGGEAPVVTLAAKVETRTFAGEEEHVHEDIDPHIWMTPANAIIMVRTIEQALSTLDPAHAETYKANVTAYEAQLEELDAWVKSRIETIPVENRKLVTDHDALGYYADRYGLEIIGAVIPATTTSAEPSAQELAELQAAITKFETKAIFVGTTINPVLAQQIAADTGIQVVPLYTGSLGEAGSGVETYLDFMRYNTMAIVEALK